MSRTAHEHSVPGKQLYKRPERKYLWNHPETVEYMKGLSKHDNRIVHNNLAGDTLHIGYQKPEEVVYVSSSKDKQKPIAFYETGKKTPQKGRLHELDFLFVHPEHRSSGIGRQVINRLKDKTVKADAAGIYLTPLSAAIPFYKRHGFEMDSEGYMNWENPETEKRIPKQRIRPDGTIHHHYGWDRVPVDIGTQEKPNAIKRIKSTGTKVAQKTKATTSVPKLERKGAGRAGKKKF